MHSNKTLKLADEMAPEYDNYIAQRYWHGPEILFGLMYEYLKKGQLLLDIGIGTGLSSKPFKEYGLKIFGIDGSDEMLRQCKKKNIAEFLKKIDISKDRIQCKKKFDLIISYGLFHMIGDLSKVMRDILPLTQEDAVFGFSVEGYNPDCPDGYKETDISGLYQKTNPDSGIEVFRHSKNYITGMLKDSDLEIQKETDILAFRDDEEDKKVYFNIYVAKTKRQ